MGHYVYSEEQLAFSSSWLTMSHLGLLILEFAFVLIRMFLLFCLWVCFIWGLLNVFVLWHYVVLLLWFVISERLNYFILFCNWSNANAWSFFVAAEHSIVPGRCLLPRTLEYKCLLETYQHFMCFYICRLQRRSCLGITRRVLLWWSF